MQDTLTRHAQIVLRERCYTCGGTLEEGYTEMFEADSNSDYADTIYTCSKCGGAQ